MQRIKRIFWLIKCKKQIKELRRNKYKKEKPVEHLVFTSWLSQSLVCNQLFFCGPAPKKKFALQNLGTVQTWKINEKWTGTHRNYQELIRMCFVGRMTIIRSCYLLTNGWQREIGGKKKFGVSWPKNNQKNSTAINHRSIFHQAMTPYPSFPEKNKKIIKNDKKLSSIIWFLSWS